MPCKCECELKEDNPINPGDKKKLSDDVASSQFSASFSKKPACTKDTCAAECKKSEQYEWSLTQQTGKIVLFDDKQEKCLIVGNSPSFTLKVKVTVRCTCPTTDPNGPTVGQVTACSPVEGSADFSLIP